MHLILLENLIALGAFMICIAAFLIYLFLIPIQASLDKTTNYLLSFKTPDIEFLVRMVSWSTHQDNPALVKEKIRAFNAFLNYGRRREWNEQTQFAQGSGYGPNDLIHTILLDPTLFECDPNDMLAIYFHRKAGFYQNYSLSLSPAMQTLVKRMLENSPE